MRSTLAVILLVLGCEAISEDPETLLVLERDVVGYHPEPKALPELRSPRRLEGPFGQGYRGGLVTMTYRQGAPLDITYAVKDGLAVPHDEHGLILWSFYARLVQADAALAEMGVDVSPIFPVQIAWNPVTIYDHDAAFENAGWLAGQQTFILWPDAFDKDVPLGASHMVVRHELGHGLFDLVVSDLEPPPWGADDVQTQLTTRALNEGFADMVSTLSMDTPDPFDRVLSMPSRRVDGDARATAELYPPSDPGLLDALTYDPYALGTVFASLAWDVRQATDPTLALQLAVQALEAWAEVGDWRDIDSFVGHYAEQAQVSSAAHEAACTSAAQRFPDVEVPACS